MGRSVYSVENRAAGQKKRGACNTWEGGSAQGSASPKWGTTITRGGNRNGVNTQTKVKCPQGAPKRATIRVAETTGLQEEFHEMSIK